MSTTQDEAQHTALINMDCKYTKSSILNAFKKYKNWKVISDANNAKDGDNKIDLQWDEYENIEWKSVLSGNLIANCYCYRKGLIRKAQLSFNINKYINKIKSKNEKNNDNDNNGENRNILLEGVPETFLFELHHPDYIEEALCDVPEVRDMEANGAFFTWILKPSMTNQGNGIFIFNRVEDLYQYFESNYYDDSSDEDDEDDEEVKDDDDDSAATSKSENKSTNSIIKQDIHNIKEWVIQRYIERPFLIDNRKFHIRTYVLAIGNLQVFVYDEMLALFSNEPYPGGSSDLSSLHSHLTNTCYQKIFNYNNNDQDTDNTSSTNKNNNNKKNDNDNEIDESRIVRLLSELTEELGGKEVVEGVVEEIKALTAEVFKACAGEIGFFPVPNCFELFGLDFLIEHDLSNTTILSNNDNSDNNNNTTDVDNNNNSSSGSNITKNNKVGKVYLLEVNAEPDFKQTGTRLQCVINDLLSDATDITLSHYFGDNKEDDNDNEVNDNNNKEKNDNDNQQLVDNSFEKVANTKFTRVLKQSTSYMQNSSLSMRFME